MAIQVVFYKFGKKINSTKRPDAETESVTYSCNMLDDCSIINPKISIAGADNTFNPSKYNYAYISSYDSRYYFVSDWTYSQGLWIASLTEDVLASWRGNIGASTQYILRAQAAGAFDPYMTDAKYPALAGYLSRNTYAQSNPFVTAVPYGTVVVGVVGKSPDNKISVTAANYFAMTVQNFSIFLNTFLSSSDFLTQVVTGVINPVEYIISCQWFPISYSSLKQEEESGIIYFGWWPIPTAVSYKRVYGSNITKSISTVYKLPNHSQKTGHGPWINYAPFTQRTFIWPPIGIVPLDTSLMQEVNNEIEVEIEYDVDFTTGGAIYAIYSGGSVITSGNCLFGVNLPITQSSVNMEGVLNNAVSSALNLAAGNYVGFVGDVVNGATQAIPAYEKTGSISSFSAFIVNKPFIRSDFLSLPAESSETYGKPSYKNLKISDIPGYIQTGNAHLEISATDNEIDQIISYMNGGFYYE